MPADARAATSRRSVSRPATNVFEVAAQHVKALQASGKRTLVASWSEGSAERMGGVLSDHGLPRDAPRRRIGPMR